MAIVWGAWTANDRWQLGVALSYSPSTVTASTSSVTVTAEVWLRVRYASSESGQPGTKWTLSGTSGWSATANFDWSLGAMGTKKIGTTSKTYSLAYGSTTKVSTTTSATVAYTYPGTGSVSVSLTLPARPYTAPAAPSGASLVRGSGESLTASWTRNATTGAPYSSQELQWLHSKTSAWYAGASPSGTATSYSSGGATDRKYQFRVRAKNSAGTSGWAESGWVSTTPATPATPGVTKNAAGDVVVSYGAPAAGSSATQYEIWRQVNGVWDGSRAALRDAVADSWTDPAPDPSKTYAYRLRAVSSGPTLYSGYSGTSATVQLQAPPTAPSNLFPDSWTLDDDNPYGLSWRHNPVDSSPQTAYELRYRINGGAWVEPGKFVSSAEHNDIVSGTMGNGKTVEWQARTWGAHADPSPWSQVAVFSTSKTPTAAINYPDGATPVDTSRLTVTWGYYQQEGSPQAQWRARLYDGGGAVLQTLSGNGTAAQAAFSKPILDGRPYSVGVSVRSAAGLWSDETVTAFTVDYPEPPTPEVTAYWRPDEGAVVLDVYVPGPAEGQPEAVTVDVFRAVEGDEWRLIADGVEPGASVTDYIPPLSSLVTYKAVAVSALPSSAESAPVEVLTTPGAPGFVFVNGGPGFSQSIRLTSNMAVDIASGRAKGVHTFRGGRRVEWAGDARSRVVGIKTDLFPYAAIGDLVSSWEDIEALADLAGPHCFRDPSGRRYFVSMSEASGSGFGTHRVGVGFTLTEVDWAEPVGASDDV